MCVKRRFSCCRFFPRPLQALHPLAGTGVGEGVEAGVGGGGVEAGVATVSLVFSPGQVLKMIK